MAVDTETLALPNRTAIETYNANFATPQDIDAMRFWLQGELQLIQRSIASAEEAIKALAVAVEELKGQ